MTFHPTIPPGALIAALRPALASIMLSCLWSAADAGTIRHDLPDSAYLELADQASFDAVGIIAGSPSYSTGTLISSRWVLTAAHVNASGFTIGGTSYGAARIAFAPGWNGNLQDGRDLALVKLSARVADIVPAEIYAGSSELGAVFTMVGFGETGTGLTGATILGGTKRAGTNVFDQFATFNTASPTGLIWDFDNPDGSSPNPYPASSATPLEFAGANHDSGAPAFITADGSALVAGVLSDAIDGQTAYGAVDFGSRVSVYKDWIDDTIASQWSGAASTTLETGGNWNDAAAADDRDILRLNGGEAATPSVINFTENTTQRKLLIEKGSVSLNLGGSIYAQTSRNRNGSVTVGRSAGDGAKLTIANGILASVDAFVGAQAGATGAVFLSGTGFWNVSDSLSIGGSSAGRGGTGSVTVFPDAALQVAGSIQVWRDGALELPGGRAAATTISVEGTLLFSGWSELADRVGDQTAIVLDGGVADQNGSAAFRTSGLSEVSGLIVDETHPNGRGSGTRGFGTLTLASSSILDFGHSDLTILHFASLTAAHPGVVLYVINWDAVPGSGGGRDQLRFDAEVPSAILSQIRFFDSAGASLGSGAQVAIGSYFEIVPAP